MSIFNNIRNHYTVSLRKMSDAELFELERKALNDHDHPFYDEIMDEADYRESINRDSRIADGMGES